MTSMVCAFLELLPSFLPDLSFFGSRPLAPLRRGTKYVRAEILVATNLMRPNRADPTKTDFISVTHINPGGIADSAVGAKIANMLCAKAPVSLLVSLERCANSPLMPKIDECPA